MSFDFGEVLGRAWQITRKHRALWGFSLLPTIPVSFTFPLITYFLLSFDFTKGISAFFRNPSFIALLFLAVIVTTLISFVLRVFSNSATAFGILQVEEGKNHLAFGEIFKGGQRYFWRIFGVIALTTLGTLVIFAVISACLSLAGFVTFGIGSLLGQILFFPVVLFLYAVTEQSQAAVVGDRMSPTDALRHAWKLVNENVGSFAALTLVLYVGLSLVSSMVMVLVMLPILLVVLSKFTSEFSNPSFIWISIVCFVAFLPIYWLVQALAFLYTKSAFIVTYLHFTRSPKYHPLLTEVTS